MEFGTGGVREIMGPGESQINEDTIWMLSCALGEYIDEEIGNKEKKIRGLVSYDARHRSRDFAILTGMALEQFGIDVELIDKISPTPLVSFCVKEFGYDVGVMITASHNPKEYNGYKIYWKGGGQIVSPHDKNIEKIYKKIKVSEKEKAPQKIDKNQIKWAETEALESAYVESIWKAVRPRKKLTLEAARVVYSALHGSGYELAPRVLQRANKIELFCEGEQCIPNGDFPTVELPNPEDQKSFEKSILLAREKDVPLILISDGDADRLGVAVRKSEQRRKEYQILDGNQQASLLLDWYLQTVGEENLGTNPFVIKTIPTTSLFTKIAEKWNIDCEVVPTGFKYISEKIEELRRKGQTFCLAAEESCGFLLGDHCLDKDGILAAWAFAHMKLTSMDTYIDLTQRYEYMVFDKVLGIEIGESDKENILGKVENFLLEQGDVTLVDRQEKDFSVDFGKIYVRVRASGTESKLKLYLTKRALICSSIEEYEKREEEAKEIFKEIGERVKRCSGAGI